MEYDSEIIVTTNQVAEGSPGEFLSRVRAISTPLRRFRNGNGAGREETAQASAILLDDVLVEITSESQEDFTLHLQRSGTEASTTIFYYGSSLFIQRSEDAEPTQMKPDTEGFGVIQFVTTIIDDLYKDAHPNRNIIW